MSRLAKIRSSIAELPVDGLLVVNPQNMRYLTGFSGGEGAVLVGKSVAAVITDFRYWEQVALEVTEFELVKQGPKLWASVIQAVREAGYKRLGFESQALSFADYQGLSEGLSDCELVPLAGVVESLRQSKDETEIAILTQAEAITSKAVAKLLQWIKPGMQEREVALELDHLIRLEGAESTSFATIIVSGWRAALPHGAPSEKKIEPGELLTIDCGALYQGYCADMTRTVVVGKASEEQQRVYQIVLQAQEAALNYLKAGLPGQAVDKVARDLIRDHGYGDNFGHGLGHSVGLNIHENPRLSMTEQQNIPVGAAVTVEPGIYLPNWGGIRIEDLVIVTETGIRNLTHSPKQELLEL